MFVLYRALIFLIFLFLKLPFINRIRRDYKTAAKSKQGNFICGFAAGNGSYWSSRYFSCSPERACYKRLLGSHLPICQLPSWRLCCSPELVSQLLLDWKNLFSFTCNATFRNSKNKAKSIKITAIKLDIKVKVLLFVCRK